MNPLLTSLREAFAGRLLSEPANMAPFLSDWRRKWTGQALAVAQPDTSGRALVLSLTRLNRVRAIDPINNTVTVDAGVTLQQLQEAAAQAHRLFPLSLATEGSCTIGGNLATNAGGEQVLRRDESARYKAPLELALMRAIKHALDPLNLMNPGKTLA